MKPTRIAVAVATLAFVAGLTVAPSIHAGGTDRGDRETRVVAMLRTLPEQDLKTFYLRCSGAALRGSLGAGEIAICSLGYEILLKEVFGGDFLALLEWSREQDEHASEIALNEPAPSGRR